MSTEVTDRGRFNPNRLTFKEGIDRIKKAADKAGLKMSGQVITSRDEAALKLKEDLATTNIPSGFRKWQLPVYLDSASQMFVTVADPGAKYSRHSHDEGDGMRFIAGGSIIYEGKELIAGDWMFIPKGAPYSFEVGRFGAIMCYCYSCCCA